MVIPFLEVVPHEVSTKNFATCGTFRDERNHSFNNTFVPLHVMTLHLSSVKIIHGQFMF